MKQWKLAVVVVSLSLLAAGCTPEKDSPVTADCTEAKNDAFEMASALAATEATYGGLEICAGDTDWYELEVQPGQYVFFEIDFDHSQGDLALDVFDVNGKRLNASDSGLDYERVAVLGSGTEPMTYVMKVFGYGGDTGSYELQIRSFDYAGDAKDCDRDDSKNDCLRIMQFPAPLQSDPYRFDSAAEFQNARRELVMLVRWALAKTYERYPDEKPLGLIDMSERDGSTPGTAYDDLRHPEGTHIEGNDMDIAYFQTTPDNRARVVCQNDGYYCTSESNTMNAEVQAYFMAQLFSTSRVRVIGVDVTLEDDLVDAAQALYAAGAITIGQKNAFSSMVASGSGWPFHHHHIHLSLDWDEGYEARMGGAEIDPYPFLE